MSFAAALNAFEAECRAAHAALREAGDDALELPTPCPPWTVRRLVVHLAEAVSRLPGLLERAEGGREADTDAAAYYREIPRFGPPPVESARLDDAIQVAERFGTTDMVGAFLEEAWRRTAAAAASAGASTVVATRGGGGITVQEIMLTLVVEATAHGRDLARALGAEPWTTPEALAVTRPVLVKVLGEEPPVELGWDDAEFFDLATGRRRLSDDEQAALGDLARRFPLLS